MRRRRRPTGTRRRRRRRRRERAAAAPANGADRLTRSEIVRRVAAARAAYEARNARKNQSEARYYEQKSNRTIELAREA